MTDKERELNVGNNEERNLRVELESLWGCLECGVVVERAHFCSARCERRYGMLYIPRRIARWWRRTYVFRLYSALRLTISILGCREGVDVCTAWDVARGIFLKRR